ncbi:MAG: ubiquinone/menaquinone biosynthesis methyltransferase [Planctomycetes bacterium]|nr:ubiquinone/menaquinone biosynthesis methyltransferase [Planctomycetota bacterium]
MSVGGGTATGPDPAAVRSMFASITPRYDLLNRVLSLRQDQRWRRKALGGINAIPAGAVVDVCSGTGDFQALARRRWPDRLVVGTDFCEPMLRRAREAGRGRRGTHVCADALRLPLRDGCAAAVLMAFGARNLVDGRTGVLEAHRILAPGGAFVLLEFTNDVSPWMRPFYAAYERCFLVPVGSLVSGTGAYGYLATSMRSVPRAAAWEAWMREAGFGEVGTDRYCGGVVTCLRGRKGAP